MATTIQQAIRPLFQVFSVICLSIHFQEKVYLSIIYNLAIWIGYTCLCYYTVIAFKVEKLFMEFNDMTITFSKLLSCVTSVIISVFYNKRFWIFMKRLDDVDNTLAKIGTLKMYHKLQTYVKSILFVAFICTFVGNAIDMKWWYDTIDNRWCIIIPFITNYVHHVIMIVQVLIFILLWYIGTRFEKINEHIRRLVITKEHELRCTWRKSEAVYRRYVIYTNNYKCIFWTLMHLHLELCRISRELNAIFGIQLTLETMGTVMILTQIIIKLFMWTPPPQNQFIHIIGVHYWILLYIIRIFCLIYLCETVSAKAKKIEVIHQLTHFLRYADIRNEIHQFTLQVLHHPLKFTGLGLFEFGYAFLKNLVATVITFVIMGVQR